MNPATSKHVTWDVRLPDEAPPDRIAINTRNIAIVGHVAGLKHVDFITDFDVPGEDSKVPEINKPSAARSLIATKLKRTPRHDSISTQLPGQAASFLQTGELTRGTIRLHTNRIAAKISASGQDMQSGRVWSNQLDHHIRSGLKQAAKGSLVTADGARFFRNVSLMIQGMDYAGHVGVAERMLAVPLPLMYMNPLLQMIVATSSGQRLPDVRWSFVPGVALDRWMLAHALANTFCFAKAVRPK